MDLGWCCFWDWGVLMLLPVLKKPRSSWQEGHAVLLRVLNPQIQGQEIIFPLQIWKGYKFFAFLCHVRHGPLPSIHLLVCHCSSRALAGISFSCFYNWFIVESSCCFWCCAWAIGGEGLHCDFEESLDVCKPQGLDLMGHAAPPTPCVLTVCTD